MSDDDWDFSDAKAVGLFLNGEAIASRDDRGRHITDDSFLLLSNAGARPGVAGSCRRMWAPRGRSSCAPTRPDGRPDKTTRRSATLEVPARSLVLLRAVEVGVTVTADPTATYRLQLGPDLGFDDAAGAGRPSCADLGVSHLYLSPILQAAPGSTHGYDTVDHGRISDELGGRAGFERARRARRTRAGLGLVVDIVPNHMSIAVPQRNRWWWDVLEQGPASPLRRSLRHHLGIPRGPPDRHRPAARSSATTTASCSRPASIALERSGGDGLVVRYFDHVLPLSPGVGQPILTAAIDGAGRDRHRVGRAPGRDRLDQRRPRRAPRAARAAALPAVPLAPGRSATSTTAGSSTSTPSSACAWRTRPSSPTPTRLVLDLVRVGPGRRPADRPPRRPHRSRRVPRPLRQARPVRHVDRRREDPRARRAPPRRRGRSPAPPATTSSASSTGVFRSPAGVAALDRLVAGPRRSATLGARSVADGEGRDPPHRARRRRRPSRRPRAPAVRAATAATVTTPATTSPHAIRAIVAAMPVYRTYVRRRRDPVRRRPHDHRRGLRRGARRRRRCRATTCTTSSAVGPPGRRTTTR